MRHFLAAPRAVAVAAEQTRWQKEADALPSARRLLAYSAVAILLLAFTVLAGTVYAMAQINDVVAEYETAQAHLAANTLLTTTEDADPQRAQRLAGYGLADARIADASMVGDSELAVPIPGSTAMLVWTPKRLGSELFAQLAPMRAATSLIFMLGIAFLMRRLYLLARELEGRRAQAQALAMRDPLTGLGNRLAFDDGIERMLDEDAGELALFYLDLDGFKQVNDTLGHGAGDDVLRTVAQRLTGLVEPDDLLVRLGGDEFVVLRAAPGPRDGLQQLAHAIEAALAAPIGLGAQTVQIKVSIGIAVAPAEGTSGNALLVAADTALYRAKRDRTGFAMAA